VNKALQLGIGVDTEIWGLRKTAAEACGELARYIGEVNRFKRKYADVLIRGTFRDTVGANVEGDCFYSVLVGPGRNKALVLRNPHPRPVKARAAIRGAPGLRLLLWRPFAGAPSRRSCPIALTLKPYEAAVILAQAP